MKQRKENTGSTAVFVLLLIVITGIILFGIILISQNNTPQSTSTVVAQQCEDETCTETETVCTTEVTETAAAVNTISVDSYDLYSSAVIMADTKGNEIYSLNADKQIYPASLTKIMTAVVAIENLNDLDDDVVIPGDIYDYITSEQASTAGFTAYESVTYRDLLYGTLLSSGAECCLTLASYIGGSEAMFVDMMNSKAEELGMNGTHFTNVCGLHDYNHYSTVSDIALLLNYALENKDFREIFTTPSYSTTTDQKPEGITLQSTMFSQMNDSEFNGGEILGGKTGFTSEAGLCLASLAEIDNKEYILVTVGADGSHDTEPYNIIDTIKIYEEFAKSYSNN